MEFNVKGIHNLCFKKRRSPFLVKKGSFVINGLNLDLGGFNGLKGF
jgi:hypothetical protein